MKQNAHSEDNEWLSRCEDFEQSVLKYKSVRFSHFVSPHELAVFKSKYRLSPDVNYMAYGGNDDCERVVLGFFPDFLEPNVAEFPIKPLLISNISGCSHRDILGAVLGLGIKREMVGDIYLDGDVAVAMCESTTADYVLYNLKTVGRKKVQVEECPKDFAISLKHEFKIVNVIVSSQRLDAIISAVVPMSRSDASKHILNDNVNVNFLVSNNPDKRISDGDIISVRHHGRFVMEGISGETRKGRIVLKIKKYI